jgi:hypothetical protein
MFGRECYVRFRTDERQHDFLDVCKSTDWGIHRLTNLTVGETQVGRDGGIIDQQAGAVETAINFAWN